MKKKSFLLQLHAYREVDDFVTVCRLSLDGDAIVINSKTLSWCCTVRTAAAVDLRFCTAGGHCPGSSHALCVTH